MPAGAGDRFAGTARAATPKDVAARNIGVRADSKGLPPGSGCVAQAPQVYQAQCAAGPTRPGKAGPIAETIKASSTGARRGKPTPALRAH